MSGFIRRGTPVYEISSDLGPSSDMLIRTMDLGKSLARELADHPLILMRGHGMTVVGETLAQAVFAPSTPKLTRARSWQLRRLGSIRFLTEAEAAAADAATMGQIGRAWEFWAIRAAASVAALRQGRPH